MGVGKIPKDQDKPILLTSLPRSGSTWAFNILGQAKNVVPLREPDRLAQIEIGKKGMHLYIRKDQKDDLYYLVYNKIFKGRPDILPSFGSRGRVDHYYKLLKSYLPKSRILVKSCFSIHNTEWIYNNFNPDIVILLRNPFSLIYSIRRMFTEANLGKIVLEDERIIDDYLRPYKDVINSAATSNEQLAVRVGAYYKIILSAAKKHPEWTVVTHEELCNNPIDIFKGLYTKLDLKWSRKIEDKINQHNRIKKTDDVHHINRITKNEPDKWKELLTKEEVDQIRYYYRSFQNGYYDDL